MMFENFNMQKLLAEDTHKENRCDSHFSMNIIKFYNRKRTEI